MSDSGNNAQVGERGAGIVDGQGPLIQPPAINFLGQPPGQQPQGGDQGLLGQPPGQQPQGGGQGPLEQPPGQQPGDGQGPLEQQPQGQQPLDQVQAGGMIKL